MKTLAWFAVVVFATSCRPVMSFGDTTVVVRMVGSGPGFIDAKTPAGFHCEGGDCKLFARPNTPIELEAGIAARGSTFLGWAGPCEGVEACSFRASATTVYAAFALRNELVVASIGRGVVRSSPEGIECGERCAALFSPDTEVTLVAEAAQGSRFVRWGGACEGTGPCVVSAAEAKLVTAIFGENKLPLRVSFAGSGKGTVTVNTLACRSACETEIAAGATATLRATAEFGSVFTGWSGACSGQGTCTVTVDEATSVTATFEPESSAPTAVITILRTGGGQGSVTSSPAGLSCGSSCTASFPQSMRVTLTAIPASGSQFVGWSGPCSGVGFCTFNAVGTTTVTASFALSGPLLLTPPSATLAPGEFITFTAVGGAPPYRYDVVSGGGSVDSQTGRYVAPPVSGMATVTVTDARSARASATIEIRAPAAPVLGPGASLEADGGADLVAGDWNRDGRVDLAVVHANGVATWLGAAADAGSWRRGSAVGLTGGLQPSNSVSIVTADWNLDGRLDLALVQPTLHQVTLLKGDGEGNFALNGTIPISAQPVDLLQADLDRDGRPDLVVARQLGYDVLSGDGDGGFTLTASGAVPGSPVQVVAGDWNRDGVTDLAMTTTSIEGFALLGSADGGFSGGSLLPTGAGGRHLASGDLDADGHADLVVTNALSRAVLVFKGGGTGAFSPPTQVLGFGPSPEAVSIDDWDGDGQLDLAVSDTGSGGSNVVMVAAGRGDGTFASPSSLLVPRGGNAVVAADFDRDGQQDLAVVGRGHGVVSVHLNLRSSRVTAFQPRPLGGSVGLAAMLGGDRTRDGRDDLVGANASAIWFAAGATDGGLPGPFVSTPALPTRALVGGDWNRDSTPDLARIGPGELWVDFVQPNGAITPFTMRTIGADLRDATHGDWNRDGRDDLAIVDHASNVKVLLGGDLASFQAPVGFDAGAGPVAVVTADWNRDGKLDLAVANDGSADLGILLGRGDGSFDAPLGVPVGGGQRALATIDWNRDGKADLLVGRTGSVEVLLLRGRGDGTFDAPSMLTCQTEPAALLTGDWNDDGVPDLAVSHLVGNVSLFFGPEAPFGLPTEVLVPAQPGASALASGDWNGDGVDDLAVSTASQVVLMVGVP